MSSHHRPGVASSSSDPPDSDSIYARGSSVTSFDSSPQPVKIGKRKSTSEPSKSSKRKRKAPENSGEELEIHDVKAKASKPIERIIARKRVL
ncbi:uncharacterized protein HD556DRAFT_1448237 [Suillus plorans]|uniref:Uncharacterized protein n=1 Tax=Suillus plorans TaxID=116603 RepID=A0A9P7DDJ6_9AGAM|nr:uncharacterized protein HD556DRAFT_1448237 [Suillus plorans]KAG1788073.1 hypothetical protein HD556DRAFT_1448237 [Suillus plorans]